MEEGGGGKREEGEEGEKEWEEEEEKDVDEEDMGNRGKKVDEGKEGGRGEELMYLSPSLIHPFSFFFVLVEKSKSASTITALSFVSSYLLLYFYSS